MTLRPKHLQGEMGFINYLNCDQPLADLLLLAKSHWHRRLAFGSQKVEANIRKLPRQKFSDNTIAHSFQNAVVPFASMSGY